MHLNTIAIFIFLTVHVLTAMEENVLHLSPQQLAESVLKKAKKILSDNPHYNNRDVIREFFAQNPQYDSSKQAYEYKNDKAPCIPKKITILGAGPSGLIAAFVLAREGHKVCVYEKRSEEEFAKRWHNVSINVPQFLHNEFPELDALLKEEHLINYEMELDDPTQLRSYRIALGDLQKALAALCQKYRVVINYAEKKKLQEINDAQIIIIATGANTLKKNKYAALKEKYNFNDFPEYITHGVAALRYEPKTDLLPGLKKERIIGESGTWGFKISIVGNGVQSQIERLAKNNPEDAKFSTTANNPALYWYLYATTKEQPRSQPFADEPDVISFVDFVPAFATQGVISYQGKPTILWGDARTSPHPLTGAALTIPFLSSKALLEFVRNCDRDVASFEEYNKKTKILAQELFIKTLLVTLSH